MVRCHSMYTIQYIKDASRFFPGHLSSEKGTRVQRHSAHGGAGIKDVGRTKNHKYESALLLRIALFEYKLRSTSR